MPLDGCQHIWTLTRSPCLHFPQFGSSSSHLNQHFHCTMWVITGAHNAFPLWAFPASNVPDACMTGLRPSCQDVCNTPWQLLGDGISKQCAHWGVRGRVSSRMEAAAASHPPKNNFGTLARCHASPQNAASFPLMSPTDRVRLNGRSNKPQVDGQRELLNTASRRRASRWGPAGAPTAERGGQRLASGVQTILPREGGREGQATFKSVHCTRRRQP